MSKEIYSTLSASFSKVDGAIQSTKKEVTKKGYDTTGIGYQHIVDRFNEALGTDGWGFDFSIIADREGTYKNGMPFHEVTVRVGIWVGDMKNIRPCVGGHISPTYSDALKGAITNGFKKTAAFWGVGREAYAGQLDDDTSYGEEVGGYGSHEVPSYVRTGETVTKVEDTKAPTCAHGPMKLNTTNKAGANFGRQFYSCPQPMGKQCPDSFVWADEWAKPKDAIIDEDGDEVVNRELAGM